MDSGAFSSVPLSSELLGWLFSTGARLISLTDFSSLELTRG